METPVVYFGTLNADALNKKASDYFKSDILNNPDLSLIDAQDEDFLEVARLIELNYPKALPSYVEPVDDEPTLEELKESFEGAKLTVDFLEGSEKQDMQDYIDGLEILIESMSFENGGDIKVGDFVNLPEIKMGKVHFDRVENGEVKYIQDGIFGVYNPKTRKIHQVTSDQIEKYAKGGGVGDEYLMKKNSITLLEGEKTIEGQIKARENALKSIKNDKSGTVSRDMMKSWEKDHKKTLAKLKSIKNK